MHPKFSNRLTGLSSQLDNRTGANSGRRGDVAVQPAPQRTPPGEIRFEVTDDWLEHLQRASVRFNSGGSGSFVSADGLVLTNHHVAAEAVQKLSSEDRDLLAEGYYARSRDSELPCVDLELNVLVSIRDVTDRINAAVSADMDAEAAFLARRAAIAAVEKESFEDTGLRSDVVTLYQGGAYHLYRFKRYTDVRLVFAPEQQIAFFGGDPDNFEYPRYALDFTFFRAYENDKPAKIDNFLRWNSRGPTDGELVFVTGHPGRTSRLLTVAELEYDRDTLQPDVISWLNRIEVLLSAYSSRSAENTRQAKDLLFVIQNSRKAYNGMHAGLLDPEFFAQKRQQETTLRQAVASNPAYQPTADAWDRIANAQEDIKSVYRAEKLINELTQPTISAIDDDDDGMGDIWECHFGAKALAPEEDEDGDGVINRDEALAGTNPLDATSAFHPVVAGEGFDPGSGNRSLVIRWNTVIGKQYELRSSSDLANWVAVGDLWPGTGQVAEMVIDLTGRSPLNDFYQVAVLDRDRDRDGLSAYEEALLGFSDLNVNSAGAPSGNDLEAARKLLTGLSPTGEIISICPDTGTSENHGPG